MSNKAIGYAIAGLTILGAIIPVTLRVLEWDDRWSGPVVCGAHIRYEPPADVAALNPGVCAVVAELMQDFPGEPELRDFAVIVRTDGAVGLIAGQELGGTTKIERMLPFTAKRFIAIVQQTDAPYYVAHEVTRHIIPFRRDQDWDPRHLLEQYAKIEQDAKNRITAALVK